MKVVTPKEMARIESLAYQQGYSEEEFMENAGRGVAQEVQRFLHAYFDAPVFILCGKGNNAGDAYVAGRHLLEAGKEVVAWQAHPLDDCSPLCIKNCERFAAAGGLVHLEPFQSAFPTQAIILDGLFGTGFHGEAVGVFAELISRANESGLPILALDIPSGLSGETGAVEGTAIIATETLFLGLPKTGFFLERGWAHVGKLRLVNFGLPQEVVDLAESTLQLPAGERFSSMLPVIRRDRHKYQAGFVIGVAGSPGMPGAAMLSSLAALRGGAGIVRLLHPDGMQAELAAAPYEIIRVAYTVEEVDQIAEAINGASAAFIGPGLGRSALAHALLQTLIPKIKKPAVIDADALYFLSECNTTPPPESILTPHRGEMARLLHLPKTPELNQEFLQRCQDYTNEQNVTLILKGAPSFVFHPHRAMLVSIHGDPGMATAGSGDVLTGLLAALLAQGLSPHKAAFLGTHLHGLAGEIAAYKYTSYSLIASDLIDAFGEAFASQLP